MAQINRLTSIQRYYWRIALELKLRKLQGDAFQEFFSDVMSKLHGDDFIRVRPYGSLGDKGCDGYLMGSGQLFQCYGAQDGKLKKVAYLVSKMNEDYGKALANLKDIMKEWHMVHNLVALPVEAVTALSALQDTNPSIKFAFLAYEGLESRVFQLDPFEIELLLGPAATDADTNNLDIVELRHLVDQLAEESDATDLSDVDLRPVPVNKLAYNELPNHWKLLISGGWKNARLVQEYLRYHPTPSTGDRVAKFLKERYKYLKTQQLSPSEIMFALYETVTGKGSVLPHRHVAAQALLAFFFENCEIFETEPIQQPT